MKVKFKKLTEEAVIPEKAHSTDAGFDMVADSVTIDEHYDQLVVGTGIAVAIPEGYVGLLFPRSSIYKTGLRLNNSVGVIDAGYRGEIKARFDLHKNGLNLGYKIGDRCIQLVIIKLEDIELEEVEELDDTDRGEGGYGSSGN